MHNVKKETRNTGLQKDKTATNGTNEDKEMQKDNKDTGRDKRNNTKRLKSDVKWPEAQNDYT